ncbi:TPA: hypothetical protein ACNV18_000505 [Pseudomonas putida]|uniref:Lipoprotein n=1 Tax=Pseudomonas putida TaxID=303 RepID=A0AAW6PYG0_PSEPU|nr:MULTISPECIES: hypothetical protein [Pseudomonas]MBH3350495.1 hypothetical protein [Pseudomonas putida]MCE0962110.1 hypothetical protein [Pseudomonas putida]MDF3873654.1 hypothetical protein [Pseudomonas putida]MDF3877059.1 hypothetical protein [Pseudomonas putida]MDH4848058.1 hypothetical protein [Pseudomonas sp. BN605]
MKHLHERRLAVTTAIKQAMLAAPLLLSGAASFAATQADPIPMLALFHTDDNGTEPACGVELPATGSGRTVNVLPKKQCPENARAPYSIRIRNVPIKSTFLLTDNERCEKANSAWVELDTSRANASLEKIGIDKIWLYAGDPGVPGYLFNTGLDTNPPIPSRGFRVIGKGEPIKQGELSCIKVTIAPRSN